MTDQCQNQILGSDLITWHCVKPSGHFGMCVTTDGRKFGFSLEAVNFEEAKFIVSILQTPIGNNLAYDWPDAVVEERRKIAARYTILKNAGNSCHDSSLQARAEWLAERLSLIKATI